MMSDRVDSHAILNDKPARVLPPVICKRCGETFWPAGYVCGRCTYLEVYGHGRIATMQDIRDDLRCYLRDRLAAIEHGRPVP